MSAALRLPAPFMSILAMNAEVPASFSVSTERPPFMNIWMLTVGWPSTGHRRRWTPLSRYRAMISGRLPAADSGLAPPSAGAAFGPIDVTHSISDFRYAAATRWMSSAVTAWMLRMYRSEKLRSPTRSSLVARSSAISEHVCRPKTNSVLFWRLARAVPRPRPSP